MALQNKQQVAHPIQQPAGRWAWSGFQNYDTWPGCRRKADDMPEIVVERDERPRLVRADGEQCLVRRTAQSLIQYRHGIMAGGTQQIETATAQGFVQLELHASAVCGMGMTLSRVISAP